MYTYLYEICSNKIRILEMGVLLFRVPINRDIRGIYVDISRFMPRSGFWEYSFREA